MDAPDPDRNYYEILLVSRDATVDAIRASYRTLMQRRRMHPDLGGDTAAAALVNKAYAVLSDASRRAEYDAYLDAVRLAARGIDFAATGRRARARSPHRECVFCGTPHGFGQAILAEADCVECMSPLAPIESLRLEAAGKRAVARIDKRQAITYFTTWPQQSPHTARTEDISLKGMRIVTEAALIAGQTIKIAGPAVDATALVTHCKRARRRGSTVHVSGIAFVTCRFSQAVGRFVSDRI